MSEHLANAKGVSSFAENLAGSPDERSVPYLLAGILDALIAVAERLPAADTTRAAEAAESEEA